MQQPYYGSTGDQLTPRPSSYHMLRPQKEGGTCPLEHSNGGNFTLQWDKSRQRFCHHFGSPFGKHCCHSSVMTFLVTLKWELCSEVSVNLLGRDSTPRFVLTLPNLFVNSRLNPFGLIIALDEQGQASGSLFWDDGDSIGKPGPLL